MSEIKAGDLVMVVREAGCVCDGTVGLGRIYEVRMVDPAPIPLSCAQCNMHTTIDRRAFTTVGKRFALRRLKKIDPLSEPEAEVYREEKKQPRELSKT